MNQQQVKQSDQRLDQHSTQFVAKSNVDDERQDYPLIQVQNVIGNHGVLNRYGIQAKLKISQTDDTLEREADRVSEEIVRMKESEILQKKPYPISIQRNCPECEPNNQLLTKENSGEISSDSLSLVNEVISSSGEPLDKETRAFMEPRFGYDFKFAKVHNNLKAGISAERINASAYTVGNNIVFGHGQYQPNTLKGKHLIAHELSHYIHQLGIKNHIFCKKSNELRKTIVDEALALSEEHYLMGAAGQIPGKGGGVNKRVVLLNTENHSASIDVYYGKKKGTKTHVCGGRYSKVEKLPEGDPTNDQYHKEPVKYKWERISDGETIKGEACEGKRHFDCGGFVSYCYNKACPSIKYPGPVSNILTSKFGWNDIELTKVRPGDIAYRNGHTGLCIDNNKVISALGKKWGVQTESISKYSRFGYLNCLNDNENTKKVEKKEKTIRIPEIEIIGIPCSCDKNTEIDYDAETYRLLSSLSKIILPFSNQRDVSAVAVAGAIADEYNTRRNIKGIIDKLQDAIIGSLPEFAIKVDEFFDIKSKLLNTLQNDIGMANIKVRTALGLVKSGHLKVPGAPISDVQISRIVEYLLTERGTVDTAAAVIEKGNRLFSKYLTKHGEELKEAVLVEFYKQGDEYFNRFKRNLRENPKHNICPGEGGCRFWHNRDKIKKALNQH